MEDEREIAKNMLDELLSKILDKEPELKGIYYIYLLNKDDISINAHTQDTPQKDDGFNEIDERVETKTEASRVVNFITKDRAQSMCQNIWCKGHILYIPVFNHAGEHFAFFSITPRANLPIKKFYTNFNILLSAIETVLNRNNLLIEK